MEVLLYYLLISGASLALGALLGRWLFLPITWHKATRAFYLIILVSAWVIPLVGIVVPYIDWSTFFSPSQEGVAIAPFPLELSPMMEEASPSVWRWLPLALGCIWGIGALARGIHLLVALRALVKLKRQCTPYLLPNGRKIQLLPQGYTAFSAFGEIYISQKMLEEGEWTMVYTHEEEHTRQRHYIDLLLAEVSLILSWWNPAMWLLRRDLSLNLEHLADEAVLAQGIEGKPYQYQLLRCATDCSVSPLYNPYNESNNLKERIKMMNKKNSPKRAIQRLWLTLPVATLTLLGGNYLLARPVAERLPLLQNVGDEDPVYETCEVLPQFPGGNDNLFLWLAEEVRYPKEAEEKSIEGRVLVHFVVEKDGSVSSPTIMQSVDPLLDAEALRVVGRMPKWTPGKLKGKVVRVSFTLPILFKLSADNAKSSSAKSSDAPKVLYVLDGKVVSDVSNLPSEKIAEMRVDKSQTEVTIGGKKYNLKALGLEGVVYITTK
ncbi:M56 family metallopeptidase [Porphyromonas endodontalis]|uniref:M56 family metallopeptidase n=1 Tax=Porphyromonas endodontalis TaxID=28124 RepID=UPI0028801ADC|nr:M56 family metallopeptidase [Porphyromonas endodontalis]